jgi:hypothetical protein
VSCPGATRILMQKSLCESSQVLTLCSLIKNWGSPLLLKGYFRLGGEGVREEGG